MDKKQIEKVFRWRKTLVNNFEKISGATKKSKKADLSGQGQLDLFSMGMDDCKSTPTLDEYTGYINLMELVDLETDLLGVPVTFEPLAQYWMFKELYCTHEVIDLLELTDDELGIIIMDRITLVDKRISQRGNDYCKIHLSQLGSENYCYLWGESYRKYIPQIFLNEIYLFQLQHKKGTKEFSQDSLIITHVKNIKDVDIDFEYNRLINSLEIIDELDEDWMIKNRKIWQQNINL